MEKSNFDIPVAVFIYRRPVHTEKLINELRKVKPNKIYVFANAPKDESESAICEATRTIIKRIDWTTNLVVNFREIHVGVTQQIVEGLDHVFSREEMALIFEDDCIPAPGFFEYCRELLLKYKSNEQVMHISGTNIMQHLPDLNHFQQSYFFTKFILPCWGWATWSRAWKKFNPELNTWQQNKKLLFTSFQQKNFEVWTNYFEYAFKKRATWDVPWNVDIWKNQGLAILPKFNLINNIGFDEGATHMRVVDQKYFNAPLGNPENPLIHPERIQLWNFEKEYEDQIIHLLSSL